MKKRMTFRSVTALLALLLLFSGSLAGCGGRGNGQDAPSQTVADKIPSDGGFYLVIPDMTAKPGDTVTVKCCLAGNPGIGGFSFCLDYDRTVFTAVEGKVTVEDNAFSTYGDKDEGANFLWTSLTPYTVDGEFCELTLKVAQNAAPGEYPLKVVFREGYDSFYKIEGEEMPDVAVTAIDGSITVAG